MKPPEFATRTVHAGQAAAAGASSAQPLSPAISQFAVFRLPSAEAGAAIHEGDEPGFFYGRMGTPTQAVLEAAMAELESGEAALATASGMSALTLSLLALLEPGSHLVAPRSLYTSTSSLIDEILEPFGVEVSRVDGTQSGAIVDAIRPNTRAILLESPSNPALSLTDIQAVSAQAARAGVSVVVDSTFATPFNQQPLTLGADLVVHSATKYLGGHGDLVAGVLIGKAELVERARWKLMKLLGPTIAPFTAWLVLRGLRTLAVRVERHNASALTIARYLEGHPRVASVRYPGLESHPDHALARRQMPGGFGGIVSFDVGDAAAALAVVNRVELCTRAVSLGDVATLIQHSSSLTQASLSAAARASGGVTDGLIRLSVGLEAPGDILADLDQALRGAETR